VRWRQPERQKAPELAYLDRGYGLSLNIRRRVLDSRYAFTITRMLMALAETNQDAKTPIVAVSAAWRSLGTFMRVVAKVSPRRFLRVFQCGTGTSAGAL
jgi:hypothetical protein